MKYPGGKNGTGTYQRLINLMGPHQTFVEGCLGSGPILRYKKPAAINIGIDADEQVLAQFPVSDVPNLTLFCTDVIEWLANTTLSSDTLVYLDPPYLRATRSYKQRIYRHEFTKMQHVQLLRVIRRLSCAVMISGYWSELYAESLNGWRTESYQAMTHSGIATEWVWMNYDEPLALHDYRYLGRNYREREWLKNMKNRWRNKLLRMPRLKRYAILDSFDDLRSLTPAEIQEVARATIIEDAGVAGGPPQQK